MTDIHTHALAAREAARHTSGQFGEQHHTAPDAILTPELDQNSVEAARATLASHRAAVVALRAQLASSERAMRAAEQEVVCAVTRTRYPDASDITTWNSDFEPVTAYDSTGTRLGPNTRDEHYELFQEIRHALDDENLPAQDQPALYQRRKDRYDLDGITPGEGPWVLISTANDAVPVISDHIEFPHPATERDLWREATAAEFERYETYWDAQED